VARSKEEIPQSIEYIAKGLIGKNLIKLDISNNAVNPFGAKALLHFLEQGTSLEVLLIYNCGLGPLGVA
jgi:Ran GTPase-activating protein 1